MLSLVTLSLAAISMVAAAPATDVVKRADIPVYHCTGSNWGNTCQTINYAPTTCTIIPEPFYESLGSLGPISKTYCRVYSAPGCAESQEIEEIFYPGNTNLYADNDAGHKAQYIFCYPCSGCP